MGVTATGGTSGSETAPSPPELRDGSPTSADPPAATPMSLAAAAAAATAAAATATAATSGEWRAVGDQESPTASLHAPTAGAEAVIRWASRSLHGPSGNGPITVRVDERSVAAASAAAGEIGSATGLVARLAAASNPASAPYSVGPVARALLAERSTNALSPAAAVASAAAAAHAANVAHAHATNGNGHAILGNASANASGMVIAHANANNASIHANLGEEDPALSVDGAHAASLMPSAVGGGVVVAPAAPWLSAEGPFSSVLSQLFAAGGASAALARQLIATDEGGLRCVLPILAESLLVLLARELTRSLLLTASAAAADHAPAESPTGAVPHCPSLLDSAAHAMADARTLLLCGDVLQLLHLRGPPGGGLCDAGPLARTLRLLVSLPRGGGAEEERKSGAGEPLRTPLAATLLLDNALSALARACGGPRRRRVDVPSGSPARFSCWRSDADAVGDPGVEFAAWSLHALHEGVGRALDTLCRLHPTRNGHVPHTSTRRSVAAWLGACVELCSTAAVDALCGALATRNGHLKTAAARALAHTIHLHRCARTQGARVAAAARAAGGTGWAVWAALCDQLMQRLATPSQLIQSIPEAALLRLLRSRLRASPTAPTGRDAGWGPLNRALLSLLAQTQRSRLARGAWQARIPAPAAVGDCSHVVGDHDQAARIAPLLARQLAGFDSDTGLPRPSAWVGDLSANAATVAWTLRALDSANTDDPRPPASLDDNDPLQRLAVALAAHRDLCREHLADAVAGFELEAAALSVYPGAGDTGKEDSASTPLSLESVCLRAPLAPAAAATARRRDAQALLERLDAAAEREGGVDAWTRLDGVWRGDESISPATDPSSLWPGAAVGADPALLLPEDSAAAPSLLHASRPYQPLAGVDGAARRSVVGPLARDTPHTLRVQAWYLLSPHAQSALADSWQRTVAAATAAVAGDRDHDRDRDDHSGRSMSLLCPALAAATAAAAAGIGAVDAVGDTVSEVSVQSCPIAITTPPAVPFAFDPDATGQGLTLRHSHCAVVNTINKRWAIARATASFSSGVHRWDVRIDKCVSKNIFVGVVTEDAATDNYVGSDAFGWGFLANRAVWHGKYKAAAYGETFREGDVVTTILDLDRGRLAFSRNGRPLGVAVHALSGLALYPAVALYNRGDRVTLCPPQRVGGVGDLSGGGRAEDDGAAGALAAAQGAALAGLLTGPRCTPLPPPLVDLLRRRWFLWRHGWLRRHVTQVGDPITLDASPFACLRFGVLAGQRIRAAHGPIFVAGIARHCVWYSTELGQRTVLPWGDAALRQSLHARADAAAPAAATSATATATPNATSSSLSAKRVRAAMRAALEALDASAAEDASVVEAQWSLQAWSPTEDVALARGLRTLATARGGLPWDLPHAMVARAPRLGADPALAAHGVGDRCARAMLLLTLSDFASPLAPAVGGEEGDPRRAVRAMAAAAMHPDTGDAVRALAMASTEESVEDAANVIAPTLLAWRGWESEEGAACFGPEPTTVGDEDEGDELFSLGQARALRTLQGLARRAASSTGHTSPRRGPAEDRDQDSERDQDGQGDQESDNGSEGSDADSLGAEADAEDAVTPRALGHGPEGDPYPDSDNPSSSSSDGGSARLDSGSSSEDDGGGLVPHGHTTTRAPVWTPAPRAGAGVGDDDAAWGGAWGPPLPAGDHPTEGVSPTAAAGLPSALAAYEVHFPVVSAAASADAWRRTALPSARWDVGQQHTPPLPLGEACGDDPFAWSVVHTAHAWLWAMDPGTKSDRFRHQLTATQTPTAPADDDFEDPPSVPRLIVDQASPEPLFRQAMPQLAWRLPLGLRRQFRSQRPFLADLQERAFRPEDRGKNPSDFGGAYRAIMIALVQSAVRDPIPGQGIRRCGPHELPLRPDGPELACPDPIVRFLGAVLGIALRTRVRVPITLPAPVWRAVAYPTHASSDTVGDCDALDQRGRHWAACLRAGLLRVVPARALALLGWRELREAISLPHDVDILSWREATLLAPGLAAVEPRVPHFWDAVSKLTPTQRVALLVAWTGRRSLREALEAASAQLAARRGGASLPGWSSLRGSGFNGVPLNAAVVGPHSPRPRSGYLVLAAARSNGGTLQGTVHASPKRFTLLLPPCSSSEAMTAALVGLVQRGRYGGQQSGSCPARLGDVSPTED